MQFGTDYSAGELEPGDLDSFGEYDIRFLMRYIGFPTFEKCVSHYPGAYRSHVEAGRVVLLVAELDTDDPAGGFTGGQRMADRAMEDAASIGYPEHLPIFFCADAWLAPKNISIDTAMEYLRGAASIIGTERIGAYGFRDFLEAARARDLARYRWLCGAAPSDTEVADGLCHFYQWNNGQISIGGMTCDLNWSYIDVQTLKTSSLIADTAIPRVGASSAQGLPTLAHGDQGPAVLSLQRFMVREYPLYNDYGPTGFYGDSTAAGLREFQRRSDLPDEDGRSVNPATKEKLWAAGWRG